MERSARSLLASSVMHSSNSDRFFFRQNRAIQAGAGTGKTHTLVTQYLHLCAGLTAHPKPLDPSHIVVLTFTEKAARELQDRIQERLKRLLHLLEQPFFDTSMIQQVEPELWATAQATERSFPSAARLEAVLEQMGNASVGTFHSFSAGLLRRYAPFARISSKFQLLQQRDALELQKAEIRRVILAALEGFYANDSPRLSAKEVEALVYQFGFSSGGIEEALPEWVAKLISSRREEGKSMEGISSVSAECESAKIWEEICLVWNAHVEHLLLLKPQLGKSSRAHLEEIELRYRSFWTWFKTMPSLENFLEVSVEILATSALFCDDLTRLRAQREESAQSDLAKIKGFFQGANREMDAIVTTQEAVPYLQSLEPLCILCARAYDQAKAEKQALDFTDLLLKTRDLLVDNPFIHQQVQSEIAVLLVDEFQDTNPIQAEIVSLLIFGEKTVPLFSKEKHQSLKSEQGLCGRLYIVGDRKQSIYQFRGANIATFLNMTAALVDGGAEHETLQQSWRSLPGLLSFANAFFADVFKNDPALDSADTVGDLKGQAGAAASAWSFVWNEERDELRPFRSSEQVSLCAELLCVDAASEALKDDSIQREALMIARRIHSLLETGRNASEIAVLFRRFSHIDAYLDVFQQQGIPVTVVKGRGYYQQQEVSDLIMALLLIADAEDLFALVSVLRSPLVGLRDDHLVSLYQQNCLTLAGLLALRRDHVPALSSDEFDHLQRISHLFSELATCAEQIGPAACLSLICEVSDYLAVLAALPFAQQCLANVELLMQMAQDFEFRGGLFQEFVDLMSIYIHMDPSVEGTSQAPIFENAEATVQVMTVHQAKGLEFPIVILAGCAGQDPLDHSRIRYDASIGLGLTLRKDTDRKETLANLRIAALQRKRQAAESLRLLYVAVTRARDLVIFAGEGTARKNTWRSYVDQFLQTDAEKLIKLHPIVL